MLEIFETATSIWMTWWVFRALSLMRRGRRDSILPVSLVFYFMYVVPVMCDLYVGHPGYSREPGFIQSSEDTKVRIIYCIFLIFTSIIWRSAGQLCTQYHQVSLKKSNAITRLVWICVALNPIILLAFVPDLKVFIEYGTVAKESISQASVPYVGAMGLATTAAVIASAMFVCISRNIMLSFLASLPLIVVSIWLNGKRAIVAVAIISMLMALYLRRQLLGHKLIIAFTFAISLLAGFSYFYQNHIRGLGTKSETKEQLYEDARIDYGRETRVKMAIFYELYPNGRKILDYRGQSLLFLATSFIPRNYWPDKPYPYAVYFTSAMLHVPSKDIGWGMTTEVFDEAISNFGWLGFLTGPGLIIWICRTGDSRSSASIKIVTVFIASMLLSVQLAAFLPVFGIWIVLIIRTKRVSLSRHYVRC